MSDDQNSEALVRLDRKLSRAIAMGKGIKLTAAELDLMTAIGAMALLGEAKAKVLKAQAEARQQRDAARGIGQFATWSSDAPEASASSGIARARRTFG